MWLRLSCTQLSVLIALIIWCNQIDAGLYLNPYSPASSHNDHDNRNHRSHHFNRSPHNHQSNDQVRKCGYDVSLYSFATHSDSMINTLFALFRVASVCVIIEFIFVDNIVHFCLFPVLDRITTIIEYYYLNIVFTWYLIVYASIIISNYLGMPKAKGKYDKCTHCCPYAR